MTAARIDGGSRQGLLATTVEERSRESWKCQAPGELLVAYRIAHRIARPPAYRLTASMMAFATTFPRRAVRPFALVTSTAAHCACVAFAIWRTVPT